MYSIVYNVTFKKCVYKCRIAKPSYLAYVLYMYSYIILLVLWEPLSLLLAITNKSLSMSYESLLP